MSPALVQKLVNIAKCAEEAVHGQRGIIYQQAALELGITVRTLHSWLNKVAVKSERKQRSDAGDLVLTREEAELISALLLESTRKNGKQLSSIKTAVVRLRANNMIIAGTIDESTGKVKLLSESAISRALYAYKLHPSQLLAPSPAVQMASLHPNHIWQVDASVSAQYYIDDDGTQAIDKKIHYMGKMQNIEKIAKKLLIRYVVTDHTSSSVYVEYVTGAETGENLCNCLINAMQQRNTPFYGVPFKIMTDPGSAMTGGVFKNFCRNLGIDLIINEVGQPRAKGQVENGNNLVEREFESGLKLVEKVNNLVELNRLASQWMLYFNATVEHSRHKRTRYGMWLTIKQQQLRIAPAVEICRELAISAPESRKVTIHLRVNFKGKEYDVSTVPNVYVGEKLFVTRNPWRNDDSAQIVYKNEEGRDCFHVVEYVAKNDYGFPVDAPVIGENYVQHADTITDKNRKALEQLITGTNSDEEAKSARKAKKVPFDGKIDPYKHITDTELPVFIPKRGHELETNVVLTLSEESKLNHIEMAKRLMTMLDNWSSVEMTQIKNWCPEGAPESELNNIAERLKNRARLSVVGG